jgi:hypothetical protein
MIRAESFRKEKLCSQLPAGQPEFLCYAMVQDVVV